MNFALYAGSVTTKSFRDHILGTTHKPSNVTVIMNQFRGFFGLYRMQVLSDCGITHATVNISVLPSQRLVREARDYARRYFGSRPYVSVMARIEKVILHSHLNLSHCAELAVSTLRQLKEERGLDDYFLAMDVGRFGSSGSNINKLQPQGEMLFKKLYGNGWTFRKWEESFAKASSKTPAYIANLQRTVAARGECLLMVGAGGFQAQARNLYQRYHPNVSTQCVYKICTDESA